MNKREPGESFSEEAKQFVDEIREMASRNYHKIISLGHDLGQKLQKTFAPKFGIGGTSTSTKSRPVDAKPIKKSNDESNSAQDDS